MVNSRAAAAAASEERIRDVLIGISVVPAFRDRPPITPTPWYSLAISALLLAVRQIRSCDFPGWRDSQLPWRIKGGLALTVAVGTTVASGLIPGIGCATDAAIADSEPAALQEVIVTATRREEKLNDVPESVSVLTGDDLQVLGDAGDDIKQLAFKVPSLQIESSNGRAFPRLYIRGYGNTDYHDFASQPVGLMYDDIVQENAALKGFPIFDQADVEVLYGPQGTLFGRNAPAGVVKFESARPELGVTSGFFSMSDGTHNTAVVQGVVNLPINDVLAFRASTQVQHRDNWVNDPINDTTLGGYEDWAGRMQLLFKPDDTFSALLNIHGRSLN